ncbi:MAG: Bax inhibitor-1 family protein [Chloroflexota bacterium]
MSYYNNSYPVASADSNTRADFIRRTYLHLAGALLVFALLEAFILSTPLAPALASLMTGGFSWLIVLGAFMLVSFVANSWAQSSTSVSMQYMGLGLFVVAEAIIFVPLLLYASIIAPQVIPTGAMITLLMFFGLSYFAFTSGKDFSFLRGALTLGGFVAIGVIVASLIFGFSLGLWFSGLMILFACGSILYDTSNVLHHYRPDQHVAAALSGNLQRGIFIFLWRFALFSKRCFIISRVSFKGTFV